MGYIGLIIIIIKSRLSTHIDMRKADFTLLMIAAVTGAVFLIGLSYLLLFVGYGYGGVDTFITRAVPSATSLVTTFAVIASASTTVDLGQAICVGAVLVSAAIIGDVTGLVMSFVIHDLGQPSSSRDVNLG